MFLRFSFAGTYLDEIQPLDPQFNAPESKVLAWLLVDNWRRWGHSRRVRGVFGDTYVLRRILA